MVLKEIFIKGFKSFADPVRLEVSDRVTVVVGPNGSGKSNVVDAIRWVLGEQSMKEIRAQEREDVVFWGNEKRPPAQYAYVELVFEDNGNKVSIARELSRDGTSRYLLNGDEVRLKDLRELLMTHGFGKNPYSIIGQGQIDKIVSATPESLRAIIEEIAGIGIYREKKKEALAKLDATQINLSRITDVLFEVDKNRKSLYLKAKRAERYLEYSQELENVKKEYYGGVYRLETQRLADMESYFNELNISLKEKLKQLAQLEMNWSTLREEFNQIDVEMESYTKTLEEFKIREDQLREIREKFTKKLNELESKYIEITTRLDMLTDEANSLKNRYEEIKLIVSKITEEINEKESELSKLEKEKSEIYTQYSEQEKEILKKKQEYEEIEKSLAKIHNEIVRLTETNQDIKHRLEMIQSQRTSKETRKQELEEEINDLEKHLLEIVEKENELVKELEVVKSSLEEYNQSKELKTHQLDTIVRRQKEILAEIDVLNKQISEYQGFGYSIRKIFENKDIFKGLIDVVANLIDFDKSLSTAYETLLGGAVQHVVVKTAEDAKQIIDFLKAGEYGRATFIPLDLIDASFSPISGIEHEPGFIGYAANLVNVSAEYRNLPLYLFGNDIIVKDIDCAIEIKRKYEIRSRIVTLDGELISGRGAISGGKAKEDYSNSLIARKVRLKTLQEELEKLVNEKSKVEKEIEEISKEIKQLQENMAIIREELASVSSKSLSSKRVLEELQKALRDVTNELSDLIKLEAEYNGKYEGNIARIEYLEEESKVLEEKRKVLQADVSEFSKELEEHRKKLEILNENIATLRAELKNLAERKLQYTAENDRINNRLEEIAKEVADAKYNISQLEQEINDTKNFLIENERELESLKATAQDIFTNIRERKSGKEEKLQQLQTLEEEISRIKSEIESTRERIHETDLRIQEIRFRISNVPEEYRNPVEIESERLDELAQLMKDLENKIKMLGAVDLSAIDEYKAVENEYNELVKQKLDLEEAKRKLEELIEQTDIQAREQFLNTYNRINAAFKGYIENLFYGGTGSMRLIDDGNIFESGIEIVVSKAGKKVQKLQLLSGGEKALVGIALIMAMLESNKGVFYVLDEVDAPLDDYNSEKFRRLLEQQQSQFIVITHNKLIMEAGDIVHGVTMVDGISKIIQVKMEEVTA
ncbi:chromosome segregation protein SMC [Fervidobacterium sp. SC_NGM5_O18]|uniref:Chromosome partition protein Smc n=1 Tax=Fervidobacterium pennivorans TaxID=93466 RepID=A0A172T417_FERPE|nr:MULTISPECIES: chromosome segregation protein SMC [Fervidobacterium]ANE41682.1 chromosome segregation protein SMC [Fervidobacterium pennivorans]NPU89475.1 chromosome segregation protein SMC [Fervidobacterium sp.]PHJ13505.1 chromosome segregation protein SMC [Fervidobacterium sp. SC_NGM5_O18]